MDNEIGVRIVGDASGVAPATDLAKGEVKGLAIHRALFLNASAKLSPMCSAIRLAISARRGSPFASGRLGSAWLFVMGSPL